MNRFFWVAGLTAVLAGCSSPVKLDNVPVEDRSGKTVAPGAAGAGGASAGSARTDTGSTARSDVKQVDLSKSAQDEVAPAGTRTVYFDYDSFAIKSEYQAVIEAQSRYAKGDKNRKIAIEGNTDERGGREYNLALGQKRAEAVRRAMGLLGVNDAQLEAVSFGKEKPAAQGSDEASLAKNRRAEIAYR